jgi:hypothetical protein
MGAKKGRLKGNSEEIRRLNNSVESFEHRTREVYNRLLERGKIFSIQDIKNELTGLIHKQRTLLSYMEEVVKDIESKIGRSYTIGTLKNWKVSQRHIETFIKEHYKRNDLALKELNLSFLNDFDSLVRRKWKCSNNTVLKH